MLKKISKKNSKTNENATICCTLKGKLKQFSEGL